MKKIIITALLFPFLGFGQQTFSEQEFLSVVRMFHPVAKQAQLNISAAKATLLKSRGAFDPAIRSAFAQKNFDGIRYYDQQQYELKIPTWYGIDFFAGTENIAGSRINPEETKGSISYAGFTLPLMQNLLLDKRRAAIKQSKLLIELSETEQKATINDLLFEALYAYWDWWQHYHMYQLSDSVLQNATKRFNMVKTAWQLGDRPSIDTIEALTQIQSFSIQKNIALTELIKTQIALSAFLWKETGEFYDLPQNVKPTLLLPEQIYSLQNLLDQGMRHPLLAQYNLKLSSLAIERKLKLQALLPTVDLKYNQLVKGYDLLKTMNAAWFQNNYRFGLTVAMPLRISEARGELKETVLKIENTKLEQSQKSIQLQVKLRQYYTEWQQTTEQVRIQKTLVYNFQQLQKGEEIRFSNGESSLFLINAREQKTLEGLQKLVEVETKNLKSIAGMKWAAGIL